jgi:hypothetical protein
VDEVLSSGGGAGLSFPSDDEGGEADEAVIDYADVPTWEEAISYLLHPNQVQVESGSPAGGSQRGGQGGGQQPRQTRHYGGRERS